MRTTVLEKIRRFEEKKDALLAEMGELDDRTLNAKPIPGKWSVIEIVEHLVNAEREVLEGLPEFETITEKERTLKSRIMYRVVMFVLGSPIRVKAPSRRMNPVGDTSIDELRTRWAESQRWFKDFVAQLDDEQLETPVFKHPVAGGINVLQAIDMSLTHIDRHQNQIQRRLNLIHK